MRERREYLTGCLTGQCAASALIVFSMGLHYLTIRPIYWGARTHEALSLFGLTFAAESIRCAGEMVGERSLWPWKPS
jgi:hypothetical protein